MEMGCFVGIHYQRTQLHLEIVVAISNCHFLHYKRQRAYFERNVYHPDNVHVSQSSASHLYIHWNSKDLCDSFERKSFVDSF